MRVAVIGSRDFSDYELLKKTLSKFDISVIVSGGARGADSLAERYAEEFNIDLDVYPAEWDKYGKRAGFLRNQTIWDNSDMGIAFWDGKSSGTKHSFEIAEKQHKILVVIEYNTKEINIYNRPELDDW